MYKKAINEGKGTPVRPIGPKGEGGSITQPDFKMPPIINPINPQTTLPAEPIQNQSAEKGVCGGLVKNQARAAARLAVGKQPRKAKLPKTLRCPYAFPVSSDEDDYPSSPRYYPSDSDEDLMPC